MHRSSSVAGRTDPANVALPAIGVARIEDFDALDAATAGLKARDRARLDTNISEKRRRELLAGRRLLRELAVHLELPVTFDGAEGGAGIEVCGAASTGGGLSASVTHSDAWIACAIGRGQGIGIDLEVLVERDFLALAEAAFPDSVASLAGLRGDDLTLAFYRRWTQHEAGIKCGADAEHDASWVLPGAWVLSMKWLTGRPVTGPLLWDKRTRRFRSLDAQPQDRPEHDGGECRR